MSSDNKCIHCGTDCGKTPEVWEEKKFCCIGCKQVYQLLNENNLCQYYTFDKTPGVRTDQEEYEGKYAYLDQEAVQEKLYEFHENNIAKVCFYIPAIHCTSCIWLLEHLNKLNRGIKHSTVNFIKKEFSVSFDTSEISVRQLVELLVSIHYIPDLSLRSLEKAANSSVDKQLMYKIGVAGFAFGNVMLYSLPEYFNGKPLTESLGVFLYYMGFALTVPLVFYSGKDYLISAFKNLNKGVVNINLPIALGILALFFVTSYQVFSQTGPGYSDSLSGFLFFLLLGRWYQNKTYQALSFDRDYKSYFPVAVSKITNKGDVSTLLEEVQIGDMLRIRNKELIPADSILLEGTAMIDYSFVTGESTPVKKAVGDFLYAGGRQTGGAINIKVEREVKQSHLTQLWNQSEEKKTANKSLVSIIDRMSIYLTVVIIFIALAGFAFWMIKGDFKTAILVFTAVLIVACPCALSMSMPFTFGNAMRMFGLRGMYVKNTGIIEKLTKIDTIVFDKTGTITKPNENNIRFVGEALSAQELQAVCSLAKQSTHPLSHAIAKSYAALEAIETSGFVEIAGKGIFARVGQLEVKLGSQHYIEGKTDTERKLASTVYVSINGNVKGYFVISNTYREGFDEVIAALSQHFDLYLLSGDNDSEREHLKLYFDEGKMFFHQHAQDKMDFVEKLQSQGRNVLMTGDGLNDAGAFMQSNVALSIADDIYHFSPAGDAIIEAKQFHKLYSFISYAQKSLTIVKINFGISFLYNLIGLSFALTGKMSPVVAALLMPISSVTVVGFATLATRLLGLKKL